MNDDIEIRPLAPDDAATILALVRKVLPVATTVPLTLEEFTVDEAGERAFIASFAESPGSLALGAFEGAQAVGCLFLERKPRSRMAHTAEFGMSVDPGCWNRRIGSRLVETMLAQVRREGVLARVQLSVLGNNPHAQRIYEKYGFAVEGRRPGAVRINGGPVDEILMGLEV